MESYSTSKKTRKALINAAGELAAELGLGKVSTRAIAQRAGENLGTIHYHFGNKDGLLKEMLRYACFGHVEPSLREVIEQYEDKLDHIEGQTQAVCHLVQYILHTIISPQRPQWCSRVLYQTVQHSGPLYGFLRKEMIDPQFDVMRNMISRIRPDWTKEQFNLWVNMLIGPVVFHANHSKTVLDHLDAETFPGGYMNMFEQRLVHDTLHALGLPSDEPYASSNVS